ncbi:MAG: MEDS domain-containing protein [Chryseosolibacter sp.]
MITTVDTNGWKKTKKDIFWGEIAPCDHLLQIYEDDKTFITTLEGFVSSGLSAGDSVIVIATAEHLSALNQSLRLQGFDLFSLSLQDQYVPLKAEDVLDQFMINGWPDENLFYHVLTNLLLRARKKDRQVRAFGEMVAVLWGQGLSGATVSLEHLWNKFCESEAFSLLCAYPKSGFTEDARESLLQICGCHSKMIDGYNHETQEFSISTPIEH